MGLREIVRYSRHIVKGKRSRLLLCCLFPLSVELFLFTAEAAAYSFLLYFGGLAPMGLFTGESVPQLMVSASAAVLRLLILPPLRCAAVVRITELIQGKGCRTGFSDMLSGGRFLRRSISSGIVSKLISTAVLLPSAVFGKAAYDLLAKGADDRKLFAGVNCAVLCLIFFGIWLTVRFSLTAVPFVLAYYPEKGGIWAAFHSLSVMRGRRAVLLKITGAYFLPLTAVLPAFYFIPEAAAAVSLGMWCIIKQNEENNNERSVLHGSH